MSLNKQELDLIHQMFSKNQLDALQELIEDRLTLISNYNGDKEEYPILLKKIKALQKATDILETIAPYSTLNDDMIKRVDIINWLATNGESIKIT